MDRHFVSKFYRLGHQLSLYWVTLFTFLTLTQAFFPLKWTNKIPAGYFELTLFRHKGRRPS